MEDIARSENGQSNFVPEAFHSTAKFIPSGKQAELFPLAERESTYHVMIETMSEAAVTTAPDGAILNCNGGFERLLRLVQGSAVGRTLSEFVRDTQRPALTGLLRRARRKPARRRLTFVTPGGNAVSAYVSAAPLNAAGEEALCVLLTDLSALDSYMRRLRQTRAQLQDVVNSLPVVLWAVDKNGTITLMEGKGLDALGISAGDTVGRDIHDTVWGCRADIYDCVQRSLAGQTCVATVQHKELFFETHYFPMTNTRGQISGAIAIASDITERRRKETEIQRAAEEERRRIGNDLHDSLGQTLTAITFLAQTMQKKLAAQMLPGADEAGQIANLAREATRQARAIAHGLCPVELRVDGFMDEMKELAERTARVFGIRCDFVTKETEAIRDTVASQHLYHIALEAVNNAVRHGQPSEIKIQFRRENGRAELEISDNGKGIGADSISSRGMGMWAMQHRANMLKGDVGVCRNMQGGVTVVCRIPNL